MGISILHQSGDGQVLGRVNERPGADPPILLPLPLEDDTFPLMRYIDEYGKTYFSSYQMQGLRPELRRLIDRAEHEVERQLLKDIDEMAAACQERAHSFLIFSGD